MRAPRIDYGRWICLQLDVKANGATGETVWSLACFFIKREFRGQGLVDQVLRAAKLTPVSFSLGLAAQQSPVAENAAGVLTLNVGDSGVVDDGGVLALQERVSQDRCETALLALDPERVRRVLGQHRQVEVGNDTT